MRNEKTNLMVQSDSTKSERIFQEKHLKILKRSTHTWPPLNNVPLIPRPLYARCSTHIWTPILLMFHSYLDPSLQNVPLIPGPHRKKCSIHTWTPPIEIRATVQIKPFWPSPFGFKTYGQSSLDWTTNADDTPSK